MCVATSCRDIVCEEEFTLCDVLKGVITKETQLGDVLNGETYREIVLAEMRSVLNFWAFGDANTEQCFKNDKFLRESIHGIPFRAFPYFNEKLFNDKKMDELIKKLNAVKGGN